ncbi:hypothetical protein FPV67DRAFT_1606272 [Lyophyllum atratum]|nr:hypothetical protein FPV67DRAFT_1606272 [Lyophyllum atratum]
MPIHTTPTLTINAPDHTIKSVTVFKSSKAEIVRQFSLDLKPGQNKIQIRSLPSTIDTHSIRVSSLGPARLFDVVCTLSQSKEHSHHSPTSPTEIIRLLRVKKNALEGEKRVREHEAELLVGYAKTLTGEHVPPGEMGKFLEGFVEQGRKNLIAITEVTEKIIELDRQIDREFDRSAMKKGEARGEVDIILGADEASTINLKLTYIVSSVSWRPTYELHATTENGKPSPSVTLHYRARITQFTGEDWTNTALTLSTISSDTVAKKIPQLVGVKLQPRPAFGVGVKGNTGMAGVASRGGGVFGGQGKEVSRQLEMMMKGGGNSAFGGGQAFAAGSSVFGTQAQAQSQQHQQQQTFGGGGGLFGSQQQQQPQQQSQTFGSGGGLFGSQQQPQTFGGAGLFGSQPQPHPPTSVFGSAPAPAPASDQDQDAFEEITAPPPHPHEPTTSVTETPVAISFSITGASSVPSDGVEHQVSVAVLPFEAVVGYVAIPRVEPRVYLRCVVRNSSEYRLLGGAVSVILDESYVSKTGISDVSTGDTFECTLGDDPATQITYTRTSRVLKPEAHGPFAEAKHTTSYLTKITLHNKHAFPLPEVLVREALPTCDDKRARVLLRKPEGLADAKDGEMVTVGKKEGKEDGGDGGEGVRVAWEKVVEGKFEWRAGVRAGGQVVLEAQWEVKAEADTYWVEGLAGTA